MSATGRSAERESADLYETPTWATDAVLAAGAVSPPNAGARWLEPSAGSGAVVRAVNAWCGRVEAPAPCWTTIEARASEQENLATAAGLAASAQDGEIVIDDFLDLPPPARPYDVAIGNPPYRLAVDFVRKLIDERWAHDVILLLRLGFLESASRYAWLRRRIPDVFVMSSRPSFVRGTTDSATYGWMRWRPGELNEAGKVVVLPPRNSKEDGT